MHENFSVSQRSRLGEQIVLIFDVHERLLSAKIGVRIRAQVGKLPRQRVEIPRPRCFVSRIGRRRSRRRFRFGFRDVEVFHGDVVRRLSAQVQLVFQDVLEHFRVKRARRKRFFPAQVLDGLIESSARERASHRRRTHRHASPWRRRARFQPRHVAYLFRDHPFPSKVSLSPRLVPVTRRDDEIVPR